MLTYLTLFLTALISALLLTPAVRRQAIRWGVVDKPDGVRRIHQRPTPRLGGVAIFLAFVIALGVAALLPASFGIDSHTYWHDAALLLAPATLIFLSGVYDDVRHSSVAFKLGVQTVAAAMLYFQGYGIHAFSLPLGGSWEVPAVLSFPLTWLWLVGITNAFNLIDGIDGLAAGASGFALLSIFVLSWTQGRQGICLIAAATIGAVVGFLHFNFHPASIFMGDSGSLLLGFLAAALSLTGSNKGSTVVAIAIPLVSFGLPVMEVGLSVARRFLGGRRLMLADRAHIHHKLLERGLSQRQTAILLYAICAGFSLFGLMLLNPARSLSAGILAIIAVGVLAGVRHLKYPEFAELENQLRGGVARRRLAVNARLRHAGADLARVRNAEELFSVLAQVLAVSDIDGITLEVAASPNAKYFFSAGAADGRGWHRAEALAGHFVWRWLREGNCSEKADADCWQLRLPLTAEAGHLGAVTVYHRLNADGPVVDLRNLCGTFQQDVSAALARLLAEAETARQADLSANATPPSLTRADQVV